MQHDGYTTEITYQVEVHQGTQETGLTNVVLLRLLVEPRGISHLVDDDVGAVDGGIVLLPGITNEEVGGLHGKVGKLADMGRVGLCTSLHVVGLQVVDVDALVVEHAVETVYRKLLIDTVDGGFDVFLALIEVVSVNGTERGLVQIGATS